MTSKPNPYVGPRSFYMGEALYGRDREVQELIDLLIAERIVLMHSPSGAGKSSLLHAALAPAMRKEGFAVRPVMRVGAEIPAELASAGNRYAMSCMQSLEEERPAGSQRAISAFTGQTLDDYLGDAGESEFLIFDQFEEILTVDPMDRFGKEAFFSQLGVVLRQRSRWALFSMREDYVAALDQYIRAVPTRLSNRYGLKLLEVKPALLAMREPAARAGVDFAAAAAAKLADDLRRVQVQLPDGSMEEQLGPYIEPVQLQVVCYRLWEHLAEGASVIQEADIGGAGDVNSALEGYYADSVAMIASASGVAERSVRDWCERSLITAQGMRGQVLQGHKTTEGLANEAIGMLVDRHLVRTEKRHGATWFELAHDRLIEPVRQSNAKWRESNLTPMQKRAALWDEQRRPASLVLLGAELSEAQRWAAGQGGLTDVERAFLSASETAQRSAERERGLTRRVRQLAVVLCVFALCAAGGFSFFSINARQAWLQEQKSDAELRQEKVAIIAANTAQKEAALREAAAKKKQGEAEQEAQKTRVEALSAALQSKIDAQNKATIATAERLAAAAIAARSAGVTPLKTAGLLAAAAYRMADTPETRSALLSVAAYLPRLIASIPYPVNINDVAVNSDGKRVAVAGADGWLRFFDCDRKSFENAGLDRTLRAPAQSIAFSPDGQLLATSSAGALTLASVASKTEKVLPFDDATTKSSRVAFAPAGTGGDWLAAATNHGLRLLNWRTGKWEPGLDDKGEVAFQVAFSADGKWVAAGYTTGLVRVFDLRTRQVVHTPYQTERGFLRSLCFSPKTNLLIWVTDGGTMQMADLSKPGQARGIGSSWSVTFRPDGSMALCGDAIVLQEGHLDARILAPPIGSKSTLLPHPTDRDRLFSFGQTDVNLWDARDAPVTGSAVTFLGRDNRSLATTGPDGVKLWDAAAGKLLKGGLGGAGKEWSSIAASPDGKMLVAGGEGGAALFCDVTRSQCSPLNSGGADPVSVAFSPTGGLFALQQSTSIGLWLADKRSLGKSLQSAEVYGVAFQPGAGNQLATGGNFARLWDIAAGKLTETLNDGDTLNIHAVAFSPDGKLLVYGKDDGSIVVRDARSSLHPQLARVRAADGVYSLAFSPDGRTLASGDVSGSLRLWDMRGLSGGEPRGQVLPIGEPVHRNNSSLGSLSFSADGSKIATAGDDGVTGIWDATPAGWLASVCERAGRNLLNAEWQESAGLGVPYIKSCPDLPGPSDPADYKLNPRDGLRYVWIPPGSFMMGCSTGDGDCLANEKPAQRVTIAKGFWLGQTDVTQSAYERVIGPDPSHLKESNNPVESVIWVEAKSYCQAVGGRLPTEAEWEYAARAGSTGARYGNLDDIAWYSGNSAGVTHAVGQKLPNGFGLFDMLGNVSQWTADWYAVNYHAGQDPNGAPGPSPRVYRGGSFLNTRQWVRASQRQGISPVTSEGSIGFRCVVE